MPIGSKLISLCELNSLRTSSEVDVEKVVSVIGLLFTEFYASYDIKYLMALYYGMIRPKINTENMLLGLTTGTIRAVFDYLLLVLFRFNSFNNSYLWILESVYVFGVDPIKIANLAKI
jgi:hypothetical protein